MSRWKKSLMAALLGASTGLAATTLKQEPNSDAGRRAYEASDYTTAISLLQAAAAQDPHDGNVQLLLAKSFLELQEHDAAIKSAERAVSIDPKSSVYHEWLGHAYGEKADHAAWFSAISLAKKTRKEFETAVQLDGKNFSARQALIEFDCSAPGMVGGGEEKALPQIKELGELDVAEGHYATGNCRRQKKDFATADAEFAKALESNPSSAELIYDIGDYAVKHSESELLDVVVKNGERAAPADPRGKFYSAVGLILGKKEPEQSERLLREYLKIAPIRSSYPRPAMAHAWLGRLFELQGKREEAAKEIETALKMDPKNKMAQEMQKRLKKG
jgi:tetratricopeptide (TPR) repeat protein